MLVIFVTAIVLSTDTTRNVISCNTLPLYCCNPAPVLLYLINHLTYVNLSWAVEDGIIDTGNPGDLDSIIFFQQHFIRILV